MLYSAVLLHLHVLNTHYHFTLVLYHATVIYDNTIQLSLNDYLYTQDIALQHYNPKIDLGINFRL